MAETEAQLLEAGLPETALLVGVARSNGGLARVALRMPVGHDGVSLSPEGARSVAAALVLWAKHAERIEDMAAGGGWGAPGERVNHSVRWQYVITPEGAAGADEPR